MSKKEMTMKLCSNIRSMREREGLSLAELAARSGVLLEYLEQLEENILPKEMMLNDAILLARTLQCNAWQLFE